MSDRYDALRKSCISLFPYDLREAATKDLDELLSIRTDWLRSQIDAARKKPFAHDGKDMQQQIRGYNAALDQILTLLETGEKQPLMQSRGE